MTNLKLKEILRGRHLKGSDLSRLSGLEESRIEEILSGAEPSLADLRMIGAALGLNVLDLVPSDPEAKSRQLLFRSVANKHRKPHALTLDRISRKMDFSASLFDRRPVEPPSWTTIFHRGSQSYAEAEENASLFRKYFLDDDQLGPLFSLPDLVVHRMNVLLFSIQTDELDGASAYLGGLPFVFVAMRFGPRMLFTLAHELAHLISHHNLSEDYVVVDSATSPEHESRTPHGTQELYAHAFASCLLMPARGLAIALDKVRSMHAITSEAVGDIEILYLSRIFGVSFAAAAKRCEDLKLLPKGGAVSLDDQLKKRFGSAEKRADSLGLPERPLIDFPTIPDRLLEAAVDRVRAGEISVGKAAAMLGLSVAEILAANAPSVN